MVNDDLVKCPLCGGFTHIDKPELLAALRDPKIRQQVENYVAEPVAISVRRTHRRRGAPAAEQGL